jgi:hypothetical protein
LGLTDFAQMFIWAAVWLVDCWHAAVESAQGHIARAIVAHSFGTLILALLFWHSSIGISPIGILPQLSP